MRKFLALGIAMLVAAGALTVFVLSGGEADKGCGEAAKQESGHKSEAEREREARLCKISGGHTARFEVRDPDRGRERPGDNPAAAMMTDRALPRGYITAQQVTAARKGLKALPTRLPKSAFKAGVRDVAARASVGSTWAFAGPDDPFAPGATTESLKDSITSGRVTGMAVDPNCGDAGHGCRLWVAAAGGGVWRTADALATTPTWTPIDSGLPTNALGTIYEDPTDASGDTLYAGTGEINAINQAGLGLYKTTDGGDHWLEVTGATPITRDRSISAVRVDPNDPDTIWIGTGVGSQGQSSVNGGAAVPPNAPDPGVYVSHDGGDTWSLSFKQAITGTRSPLGGVTDLELDPADPTTVYATFFGSGAWRSVAGGDWEQVYSAENEGDSSVAPFDRTELALATKNGHTRIYAADGGFDGDFNNTGRLFRVDDADELTAAQLDGAGDNAGWTQLSNSQNGTPGFASYQLCQGQCDYDLFLEVDPNNPDTVWFGGSMVYEEIRPLQDQSLAGTAWRSNGRAVMRSTDAGVHFTDMTADNEGALQPNQHQYEQMHPDQHALVFDPSDPNIAFVGSDGGVVRTSGSFTDMSDECTDPNREIVTETDATQKAADLADCQQWLSQVPTKIDNLNNGLGSLQFVQLSVDPKDAQGDLLGGTQDNGTFSYSDTLTPGTRSWFESVNGDGAASGFDSANSSIRYHTYFLGAGDINHHGSDPQKWSLITQPVLESGENVSFYTPVVLDSKVPGTIYLGAQHVWRTKDNGGDQATLEANCLAPGGVPQYTGNVECGDFEPIGADLTTVGGTRGGQYLAAVERAPSDTGTLWAATRLGRLFVTTNADAADAGKVQFDRIDTAATPGRFVSGIAIDPADPNHAYVSYSGYNAATQDTPGHVFDVHYSPATHDASFTRIDGNLPDAPITDVAYDDFTGDLYAGTDYTVLRRPAGSADWEEAAPGIPLASVPGLTLRTDGRVLYAPTYGRSVWKLALGPGARIVGPSSLTEGQTAVYDGSESRAYGGASLTYEWTLPDGTTSTGPTVAYTASGTGTKTLVLKVTAPDGRSATTTKPVDVTAGPGSSPTPGTTPTPTPGGGGSGTPGFALIHLKARSVPVRKNVFRVGLVCPPANTFGCAGTVKLTSKVKGKTRTLRSAAVAIPKGKTVTLKVRISKRLKHLLGSKRRLAVTVTVRQLTPTGAVRTKRLSLTVRLRR